MLNFSTSIVAKEQKGGGGRAGLVSYPDPNVIMHL